MRTFFHQPNLAKRSHQARTYHHTHLGLRNSGHDLDQPVAVAELKLGILPALARHIVSDLSSHLRLLKLTVTFRVGIELVQEWTLEMIAHRCQDLQLSCTHLLNYLHEHLTERPLKIWTT